MQRSDVVKKMWAVIKERNLLVSETILLRVIGVILLYLLASYYYEYWRHTTIASNTVLLRIASSVILL